LLVVAPPASNARELSSADSGGDRPFRDQLQRAAGGQTDRQKTEADRPETPVQATRSQGNDAEQDSGQTDADPYDSNESVSAPPSETESSGELSTGDQVEVSVAAVAVLESQNQDPLPTSVQEVQAVAGQGAPSEDELPAQIPVETNLLNPTDGEEQPEERSSNSGKQNVLDAVADSEVEIDSDPRSATAKSLDSSGAPTEGLKIPDSIATQEPVRLEAQGKLQENELQTTPSPTEPETSSKQNKTTEKTNSDFLPPSTSTPAESEAAERGALAGHEGSPSANTSENDISQRPTAPDSIRALERALGNRSVRTDSAASQAEPTTPVDRARFVQRVGNALRTANQQEGHVQLRLSPPELGSLRIEITVQQGTLTARIEAETTSARTLLLDNLPVLRERLAEQEIRIERFDVDVRQEGQQQPEDRSTDSQRSNRRSSDSRSQQNRETLEEEPETPVELLDGVASAITSEGLDVRI